VFENNPYLWIGAAKKVRLDTLDELRRSILLDYPVNTFFAALCLRLVLNNNARPLGAA